MRAECLECHIDDRRVAVPVETIQQIADLPVAPPPPLAADWLHGFALHRDQILPLVSTGTTTSQEARVRCLMLRDADVSFCVRVTRVLHTLQVELPDDGDAHTCAGTDAQGRPLTVLRPGAIARDLIAGRRP